MPADPDLALAIPRRLWAELLVRKANPLLALIGELDITAGSTLDLKAFFGRFEQVRER